MNRYGQELEPGTISNQTTQGESISSVEFQSSAPKPAAPTIAHHIVGRLDDIKPHGAKAQQLRDFVKKMFGIETHPKTIGMTLYRLSQENPPKVHRKGHTWFFGQPPAEAEKPGASTPGQLEFMDK